MSERGELREITAPKIREIGKHRELWLIGTETIIGTSARVGNLKAASSV